MVSLRSPLQPLASRWPEGQPATGPVGSPSEGFQAAWDLGSTAWGQGSPYTTQVLELRGYPWQKNCYLSPGSLRLKATRSLPQSCYFIASFLLALGQRAEKEDLLAEQGQRMPNSRLWVLQREWPQSQRTFWELAHPTLPCVGEHDWQPRRKEGVIFYLSLHRGLQLNMVH